MTLEKDRGPKLVAYGRAGIPVYWIVNLIDRQLEICTEPYLRRLSRPAGDGRGRGSSLILEGKESAASRSQQFCRRTRRATIAQQEASPDGGCRATKRLVATQPRS